MCVYCSVAQAQIWDVCALVEYTVSVGECVVGGGSV
jgi:hypothetical protein